MDVNSARDLATIIEGRSDDDILVTLREIGVGTAMEKVFTGMTQAFLPQHAAGEQAVIQWNVHAAGETHTYQLKVADGRCVALKGAPETPRVTLSVDAPVFLRVITGKVNPTQAVFTGKLNIDGDMLFAMKQERWFDKNWAG